MDFFSFLHFFKHTFCNNFKQVVGPGVLQTFSTCAVKALINKFLKFLKSKSFSNNVKTESGHPGPALQIIRV